MRLINTTTGDLEDLPSGSGEPLLFAILSHTWGSRELVYEDLVRKTMAEKSVESVSKFKWACAQARRDGHSYIWIDSCCIDKSSSAELSEAINSMYRWYTEAQVCYAYLDTAPDSLETHAQRERFRVSRWFSRGWTLQELLAPKEVLFYSRAGVLIGTKTTLSHSVAQITGIDEEILTKSRSLFSTSVAKRMSWAAQRQTTRPEDLAYCLMGMFSVNMPMLYGEGAVKAFIRLQEEIMKSSDDHSLFAWKRSAGYLPLDPEKPYGLLATSPHDFVESGLMLTYDDWESREPYSMTNRGLHIKLHLTPVTQDDTLYIAALMCPVPPDYPDSTFLGIYLRKLPNTDDQYARVRADDLALVQQRGLISPVYVPQKPRLITAAERIVPRHVLQLCGGPAKDTIMLNRVLAPTRSNLPRELATIKSARTWVPSKIELTYDMPRRARALAVVLEFLDSKGLSLAIMIGSARSFEVAFDVVTPAFGTLKKGYAADFEEYIRDFDPSTYGKFESSFHKIYVAATPITKGSIKYYMIDIEIHHQEAWFGAPPEVTSAGTTGTGKGTTPFWKRLIDKT